MAVYKYSPKYRVLPQELNTQGEAVALTPDDGADAMGVSSSGGTGGIPKTKDENTTKLLILAVILFALIFLFK